MRLERIQLYPLINKFGFNEKIPTVQLLVMILNKISTLGYSYICYADDYGFAGIDFVDEKEYLAFRLKYL
jgi:hypothetical protein